MPLLADSGFRILVPDMRGYGDSDKPAGNAGYDSAALGEEFRSLVEQIGFGAGRPLTLIAHDMGAPPALLWAAAHPTEISALLYVEAPVMLQSILEKIITFNPVSYTHLDVYKRQGGFGQKTWVRTRQAGKVQRGWRASARTRPNLGSAHLPGFV